MGTLLALALAATQSDCGAAVVSGTGPVVSLYDRAGLKIVDLKVKDNSLPEMLPIIRCSATRVLVDYKGQQLVAERYQIVTREAEIIVCTGSGGDIEGRSSLRTMNGLSVLGCRPPKPPPGKAVAVSAKKKRR